MNPLFQGILDYVHAHPGHAGGALVGLGGYVVVLLTTLFKKSKITDEQLAVMSQVAPREWAKVKLVRILLPIAPELVTVVYCLITGNPPPEEKP